MKNVGRKKEFFWGALFVLCSPFLAWAEDAETKNTESLNAQDFFINMCDDIACLTESYPGLIEKIIEDGTTVWLELHDGRRVVYADDRQPQWDKDGGLSNATVQQSMVEPYPLGEATGQGDPGRARPQEWLEALYGTTEKELELRPVQVGQHRVRVSSRYGTAEAFSHVAKVLEELATTTAAIQPHLLSVAGYSHRNIAGTTRPSPHSYGIAIDLNPKHGAYWRWNPEAKRQAFQYPQAIVDIFEEKGFIWGGKWSHYDLMHFEYRPEIVCKAKLRAKRLTEKTLQTD